MLRTTCFDGCVLIRIARLFFHKLYKSDSSKLWEGQECFLDTSRYKRFLQAVRDMILQEAREQFFDTTRGARANLLSYKRYESDSLKQQEQEEKYANRPAMVEAYCLDYLQT